MNQQSKLPPDIEGQRVASLIAGYIRKTLSSAEHDELDRWVEASDANMQLFEELTDEDRLARNLEWLDNLDTEKQLAEVKKGMKFTPQRAPGSRIRVLPLLAVAAIVTALVIGLRNMQKESETVPVDSPVTEIIPPANKTLLILDNGRKIPLDSARIFVDNATSLSTSGGLNYRGITFSAPAVHTLSIPAGTSYHIVMADGTGVWLNAGSSLKYAVPFASDRRLVELNGEGYFEVTKDPSRPFIVKTTRGTEVRVLGTSFDVNAYSDEGTETVSLLEGSIELTTGSKKAQVVPGQQYQVRTGEALSGTTFDAGELLAWKDDRFVFRDATITEIMQQVKRWYDIDVRFSHRPATLFNATVSRREPLSKLLRLLELTGSVHFKTENRTVYVLQ